MSEGCFTASRADFAFRGRPSGTRRPLVTVAIPAFNRPALLAQALESVARQTARIPLEVIVCDDLRRWETQDVVRRFPQNTFFYRPNPSTLGAVGNWNRCLSLARGDWVTVLHEDDALYPWYLESVLPSMLSGCVGVCMKTSRGPSQPYRSPPGRIGPASEYLPQYFIKSSMTPFPGVLMQTDAARRLGPFNEAWGPIADYEFWYRLACLGKVLVVPAVGAFYRVAPGQWTEKIWQRMLRLTHLLRLRIAHEQFPGHPRAGRWLARFFTFRNARSYLERFGAGPEVLGRCLSMGRAPFAALPAGWVWQALKVASRIDRRHLEIAPDARRTPQIQQGGRGTHRIAAEDPVGGPEEHPQATLA